MVIRQQQFSINQVRQVLGGVLGHDLHAKRVASLCDATLGVLRGASLAGCTIGHGLAAARGLNSKHATKQVDRLLSNPNINVDDILARWVPYIVGARSCIVVALAWTDFDADKQATIQLDLAQNFVNRRRHEYKEVGKKITDLLIYYDWPRRFRTSWPGILYGH